MNEEKMTIVKTKTTYTKENYVEFNVANYFYQMKKLRFAINIMSTILLICFLTMLFLGEFFIFPLIVLAIIQLVMNTSIVPKFYANLSIKDDKNIIGIVNEYTFSKNNIAVTNELGNTKIEYTKLYSCVETDDYYYFYISKNQAFLVSKESLEKSEISFIRESVNLNKVLYEKVRSGILINKIKR